MEGHSITATTTASAQAAVRQPSTPASGRGTPARRTLARHSTLSSTTTPSRRRPITRLPRGGLVQLALWNARAGPSVLPDSSRGRELTRCAGVIVEGEVKRSVSVEDDAAMIETP